MDESRKRVVHPSAHEAHLDALRIMHTDKLQYNPDSGVMSVYVGQDSDEIGTLDESDSAESPERTLIEGSPGEVMSHKDFGFGFEKDQQRLDLAFELGYLFGKRDKEVLQSNEVRSHQEAKNG